MKKNITDVEIVEKGAPSLIINNTLTIDKKEIIDLMIFEKEEMLKEEVTILKAQRDDMIESWDLKERLLIEEELGEALISARAKVKKAQKLLFPDAEVKEELAHGCLLLRCYENGHNCISYAIPFTDQLTKKLGSLYKEKEKESQELYQKVSDKNAEICDLPAKAKKLKASALKKALQKSKDGREILDYFRNLREKL